jgi:hypothetical protein
MKLFTNTPPPDTTVSPIDKANFLSKLTFQWIHQLIMYGRHTPLTIENIPVLCKDDDCKRLSDVFQQSWNHQLELVRKGQKKSPSFWIPLIYTIRKPFILSAILGFMESVFKIMEAVFLGYVVRFFQDPDSSLKEVSSLLMKVFINVLITLFILGLLMVIRINFSCIGSYNITSSILFSFNENGISSSFWFNCIIIS